MKHAIFRKYISYWQMSLRRFVAAGLLSITVLCALVATSEAAPAFSNFGFGSGIPFGGTTSLSGVTVTLVSINTEPFGPNRFRDDLTLNPALVTFTFDAPITEFHLDVSFVRADESLTGFSLGDPSTLTGTLVNNSGLITTSGPDDSGSGRLSWTNIYATTITFTIDADGTNPTPALAVDQFGIDIPIPAVPTLSPIGIAMLLSLLGLAGYRRLPLRTPAALLKQIGLEVDRDY
jgi:hypothetical protein